MKSPRYWLIRVVLVVLLVMTNVIGAAVVFSLTSWAIPLPPVERDDRLRIANLILLAIFLPCILLFSIFRSRGFLRPLDLWARESRTPTVKEKKALLRAPRRLFWLIAVPWGFAAVLFGAFNAREHPGLGALVAANVAMGGITACAVCFLIAERVLRPLTREAMASGLPEGVRVSRVSTRAMFAWVLGSGVSAFALGLAGLTALTLEDGAVTQTQQGITMIALSSVIVLTGGYTAYLAARATSDPVRSLRDAVDRVGSGYLDVQVPIDDGTEIGVLQSGFNEMVKGLREREELHDLFGRHVGVDVARAALDGGVQLGGEVREVTVLFVDVVGSTKLATERSPEEVVAALNRFFEVVIDVVHQHSGWINKFEGDAALAIWGAPVEVKDRQAKALAAARTLTARLSAEVPELSAGIGISGGPVVSGNIGSTDRYEYTVIGDAVNEAARLTDLSKARRPRVVANAGLLEDAGDEAEHWAVAEPIVVRGRSEPTPIAVLRGSTEADA